MPANLPTTSASPPGLKTLPFQPAVGALERSVDVVIAAVACARIGFGQGHFVVNVRVLVAQGPAAGSACPSSDVFTEPAFHGVVLPGQEPSKIVLQNRTGKFDHTCLWNLKGGLCSVPCKPKGVFVTVRISIEKVGMLIVPGTEL